MARFVALLLVVTMATYSAPVAAATAAAPPASAQVAKLGGYVFASDGLSPLAGVNVKAAHLETKTVYTSSNTKPDGRYSMTGLPPGTYELAVQTPEGLFAARTPVKAAAGQRTLVSIAINPKQPQPAGGITAQDPNAPPAPPDPNATAPKDPNAAAPKDPNTPATPADPNASTPPEPEPESDKDQGGGFFTTTWGATLLIFGGALGVAAAANAWADDEEGDDSQPLTQSGN